MKKKGEPNGSPVKAELKTSAMTTHGIKPAAQNLTIRAYDSWDSVATKSCQTEEEQHGHAYSKQRKKFSIPKGPKIQNQRSHTSQRANALRL
jgi:hypothetical protein